MNYIGQKIEMQRPRKRTFSDFFSGNKVEQVEPRTVKKTDCNSRICTFRSCYLNSDLYEGTHGI